MNSNLQAKTLAHDLRSPLSALKLTTQGLELSSETQNLIEQSLRSLEQLVQRVSCLGRPAEQKVNHQSRPYFVIQKCVRILNQKFSKSGKSIEARLDAKAMELTSAIDELDLERALNNLLTNALEAICENQQDQTVLLVLKVKRKSLRLFIEDCGKGIPSHLLGFVGSPGATFGKQQGTGFGLFQAKNAIEKSGGRLLIRSVEGKGTIVTLDIPFISPLKTDDLLAEVVRLPLSLCA